MFLGEHQHVIDEKGRIFIPASLREELGERFVLAKGFDHCLFLYPALEWEHLGEKLRELPFTKADVRSFVRLFFASASVGETDRQGRVLVQPGLRRHASLEKEVTVIGVYNRVEIWDRRIWEEYSQGAAASFEDVAERIMGPGGN